MLISIPCSRCLEIYFSNASSSGFNWPSGPRWTDFFLVFSSALMGSLPRLKRSAHLVRSKADTWTLSVDFQSKMPSSSWRCFAIVRRASFHHAVYRTRICHKMPPGWARRGMGCNMGLGVSWLVRGWKDGTHPMCAVIFNSGTVQPYCIGEGGSFRYFRFLIPTSPQYIARVFFTLRRKTTSKDLSHWRTVGCDFVRLHTNTQIHIRFFQSCEGLFTFATVFCVFFCQKTSFVGEYTNTHYKMTRF